MLHDVDVLVDSLVHALEVALAGQRHQRRAVEEGVGDGGDQVGGARAERAEADAGAAGQAAVDVGHVGAALLVAHGNEVDGGVVERLVEIEGLLARDAEHVTDPFGFKTFDEDSRCFRGWHVFLSVGDGRAEPIFRQFAALVRNRT